MQFLRNIRYHLSQVVPMPFRSTYGVHNGDTGQLVGMERSTWVQWRGRIFRHRRTAVA
jgi:hypothetical protein